jgi:hypothetical protein
VVLLACQDKVARRSKKTMHGYKRTRSAPLKGPAVEENASENPKRNHCKPVTARHVQEAQIWESVDFLRRRPKKTNLPC